jgi:transcriptional regulator with XRE-family HTH domain
MKTEFAERLTRIMSERHISQSDLARMMWGTMMDERGYEVARNRQVLGKYIAGTVNPRLATKRRMAEVLDVPLSELDPNSDPLARPGSGLYVEKVDEDNVRVEVRMVIPRDVAHEVIALLSRYTV